MHDTKAHLVFLFQVSQKVLEGRKTVKQVQDMWEGMWDRFKAVRRRQEHTGGGDGNDATESEKEESDEVKEVKHASTVKGGNAAEDLPVKPFAGMKRKRPAASSSTPRFSKRVLDRFEESQIFYIIDSVYVLVSLLIASIDVNNTN